MVQRINELSAVLNGTEKLYWTNSGTIGPEQTEAIAQMKSAASWVYRLNQQLAQRKRAIVFAYGLSSLPEDTLLHIIQLFLLNSGAPSWTSLLRLSHLCRRFRQIIFNASLLWSCISSEMRSIELVKMFIKNGREADLYVTITFGWSVAGRGCDFRTFLELVLPHSNRFVALKLGIIKRSSLKESLASPWHKDDPPPYLELFCAHVQSLPRLRTLEEYSFRMGGRKLSPVFYIFDGFIPAPALRSLSLGKCVDGGIPSSITKSVIALDITIGARGMRLAIGAPLISMLSTCLSLEHLRLDFVEATLLASPEAFGEIVLPSITSLVVRASRLEGAQSEQVIEELLRACCFPNIASVSFFFEMIKPGCRTIVEALLSGVQHFPKLRTMKLHEFPIVAGPHPKFDLPSYLESKTRNLEHVTLSSSLSYADFPPDLPPLRSMNLIGVDLDWLFEHLLMKSDNRVFGRLEELLIGADQGTDASVVALQTNVSNASLKIAACPISVKDVKESAYRIHIFRLELA